MTARQSFGATPTPSLPPSLPLRAAARGRVSCALASALGAAFSRTIASITPASTSVRLLRLCTAMLPMAKSVLKQG